LHFLVPSVPALQEQATKATLVEVAVATSSFSLAEARLPKSASCEHFGSNFSGVLKPTSLTRVPSFNRIVSPRAEEGDYPDFLNEPSKVQPS
jgi:hypothetical protein